MILLSSKERLDKKATKRVKSRVDPGIYFEARDMPRLRDLQFPYIDPGKINSASLKAEKS